MTDRASTRNVLLSLCAFVVFMLLLLGAMGFGVGAVELVIWLALLAVGVAAIIRRHQAAKREDPHLT